MSKHSKSIEGNKIICLGVVGIILIIIGMFLLINNIKDINTSTQLDTIGKEIKLTNGIKKYIYEKVKKDITENLKTPSTAIFPEIKDWDINVNYNNVIEVKSHVDSQNSFGAMLRADFEQHYILLNKDEYICIYKEFNNEVEFDITEKTEYKKVINEEVFDFQIEDFIEKSKNATIYGNLLDYNYSKETQSLEINLVVKDLKSEYFDYRNCINSAITAYIDQCVCIPTVTTKLNIKNESNETVAVVTDINIDFLLNDWYILWDIGIMNTDATDLEEKLKDRLWISDKIK